MDLNRIEKFIGRQKVSLICSIDEENYPKQKASEITEGIMSKLFFTDFTLTFEPFDTIPSAFNFKEGDGEGAFVIRNVSVE